MSVRNLFVLPEWQQTQSEAAHEFADDPPRADLRQFFALTVVDGGAKVRRLVRYLSCTIRSRGMALISSRQLERTARVYVTMPETAETN